MGLFFSVVKGFDEFLVFLEIYYKGSFNVNELFLVFVGKGIIFDSGGIFIKVFVNMDFMRVDMGGVVIICLVIVFVVKFNLFINIIGLVFFCENMFSGKVNKLGDVVRVRNGKII